MTDEEKIRNCIELIWDYEEVYDDDDLINFQNKELGTYTQYNNILNKLTKYTQLEEENTELKEKLDKIRNYLANDIPHELMNEATNKIWRML